VKPKSSRSPRTSESLNERTVVDADASSGTVPVTLSGDATVLMCADAADGGRVELYVVGVNAYAVVLNGRVVEQFGGAHSRNAGAAVAVLRKLKAK
jgi:hypothetical protein